MNGRATGGGRAARVSVVVTGVPRGFAAARGLGPWLAGAAPPRARGDVTVALVTDPTMRRLNARYRGHDAVTDVLSFADPDASSDGAARYLGDIAIARGRARRQAADCGHPLRTELRVLALHGLLHLLGYDHEQDRGEMYRVEERLRRRSGLPAGLIARAEDRSNPPSPKRPRRRAPRSTRS